MADKEFNPLFDYFERKNLNWYTPGMPAEVLSTEPVGWWATGKAAGVADDAEVSEAEFWNWRIKDALDMNEELDTTVRQAFIEGSRRHKPPPPVVAPDIPPTLEEEKRRYNRQRFNDDLTAWLSRRAGRTTVRRLWQQIDPDGEAAAEAEWTGMIDVVRERSSALTDAYEKADGDNAWSAVKSFGATSAGVMLTPSRLYEGAALSAALAFTPPAWRVGKFVWSRIAAGAATEAATEAIHAARAYESSEWNKRLGGRPFYSAGDAVENIVLEAAFGAGLGVVGEGVRAAWKAVKPRRRAGAPPVAQPPSLPPSPPPRGPSGRAPVNPAGEPDPSIPPTPPPEVGIPTSAKQDLEAALKMESAEDRVEAVAAVVVKAEREGDTQTAAAALDADVKLVKERTRQRIKQAQQHAETGAGPQQPSAAVAEVEQSIADVETHLTKLRTNPEANKKAITLTNGMLEGEKVRLKSAQAAAASPSPVAPQAAIAAAAAAKNTGVAKTKADVLEQLKKRLDKGDSRVSDENIAAAADESLAAQALAETAHAESTQAEQTLKQEAATAETDTPVGKALKAEMATSESAVDEHLLTRPAERAPGDTWEEAAAAAEAVQEGKPLPEAKTPDLQTPAAAIKTAPVKSAIVGQNGEPLLIRRVGYVNPDQIKTDPAAFQIRPDYGKEGSAGTIEGVEKYDNTLADDLLFFEKDGELYVVDGHNRLALAKELRGKGNKSIAVGGYIVREKDGWTQDMARALGAIHNIAQPQVSVNQRGNLVVGESERIYLTAVVLREAVANADIMSIVQQQWGTLARNGGFAATAARIAGVDIAYRFGGVQITANTGGLKGDAFTRYKNRRGEIKPAHFAETAGMIPGEEQQLLALSAIESQGVSGTVTDEMARDLISSVIDYSNAQQDQLSFLPGNQTQVDFNARATTIQNFRRLMNNNIGAFNAIVNFGGDIEKLGGRVPDKDMSESAKGELKTAKMILAEYTKGIANALNSAVREVTQAHVAAGNPRAALTDKEATMLLHALNEVAVNNKHTANIGEWTIKDGVLEIQAVAKAAEGTALRFDKKAEAKPAPPDKQAPDGSLYSLPPLVQAEADIPISQQQLDNISAAYGIATTVVKELIDAVGRKIRPGGARTTAAGIEFHDRPSLETAAHEVWHKVADFDGGATAAEQAAISEAAANWLKSNPTIAAAIEASVKASGATGAQAATTRTSETNARFIAHLAGLPGTKTHAEVQTALGEAPTLARRLAGFVRIILSHLKDFFQPGGITRARLALKADAAAAQVLERRRLGARAPPPVDGVIWGESQAAEGMFWLGGQNARGVNIPKLVDAMEMMEDLSGLPENPTEKQIIAAMSDKEIVDKVWKETGWILGIDGQWRFEIDDKGISYKPYLEKIYKELVKRVQKKKEDGRIGTSSAIRGSVSSSLREIIDAPDLFAVYPHIGDTKVKINISNDRVTGRPRMNATYSRTGEINISINIPAKYLVPDDVHFFSDLPRLIAHEVQHAVQYFGNLAWGSNSKSRDYTHSAGEAEAREVENRLDKSAEWRRDNPPSWDGIAPKDLLLNRIGQKKPSSLFVGYDHMRGKSNNAVAAEDDGIYSATKAAKVWGFKSGKVIEELFEESEWHHTGNKYKITDYYDIPRQLEDLVDSIATDSMIFEGRKLKYIHKGADLIAATMVKLDPYLTIKGKDKVRHKLEDIVKEFDANDFGVSLFGKPTPLFTTPPPKAQKPTALFNVPAETAGLSELDTAISQSLGLGKKATRADIDKAADEVVEMSAQSYDESAEFYDKLPTLIKPERITTYDYLRKYKDKSWVEMNDAGLSDEEIEIARLSDSEYMYRVGDMRAEVLMQRDDNITSAARYLDHNISYTPVERAAILIAVSKFTAQTREVDGQLKVDMNKVRPTNTHAGTELNGELAAGMRDELQAGKSMKDALAAAKLEYDEKMKAANVASGKVGWVVYPQTTDAKEAATTSAECTGTGWCIAQDSTMSSYLSRGDLALYYDDGKPQIAIGYEGKNRLHEPPRGRLDGQRLPEKYDEIAEAYLRKNKTEGAQGYYDARQAKRVALETLRTGKVTNDFTYNNINYNNYNLVDEKNLMTISHVRGYDFDKKTRKEILNLVDEKSLLAVNEIYISDTDSVDIDKTLLKQIKYVRTNISLYRNRQDRRNIRDIEIGLHAAEGSVFIGENINVHAPNLQKTERVRMKSGASINAPLLGADGDKVMISTEGESAVLPSLINATVLLEKGWVFAPNLITIDFLRTGRAAVLFAPSLKKIRGMYPAARGGLSYVIANGEVKNKSITRGHHVEGFLTSKKEISAEIEKINKLIAAPESIALEKGYDSYELKAIVGYLKKALPLMAAHEATMKRNLPPPPPKAGGRRAKPTPESLLKRAARAMGMVSDAKSAAGAPVVSEANGAAAAMTANGVFAAGGVNGAAAQKNLSSAVSSAVAQSDNATLAAETGERAQAAGVCTIRKRGG